MGLNKPVDFTTAKLLKEKGYDGQCLNFYTKPNSKMFGIDEHYRNYPIKNTPKKLYTVGEHAVLNIENVYFAPTIAEIVMWCFKKHGIWITVCVIGVDGFGYWLHDKGRKRLNPDNQGGYWLSPTEAYEAAIKHCLEKII